MSILTIAIIELDDISPNFPAVPAVARNLSGGRYAISGQASLIPLYLDGREVMFERRDVSGLRQNISKIAPCITEPVIVNGTAYGPATPRGQPVDPVDLDCPFSTTTGKVYFLVRIRGVTQGLTGHSLPEPGQSFTIAGPANGAEGPSADLLQFASSA